MLAAAGELFRERGFDGVGVAEILERARAPRGSLYFHFPRGKEQIGAEVIRRNGEDVARRFHDLHESGVDLSTFVSEVFIATAKESKDRHYRAACPMAAIAMDCGDADTALAAAVRDAFTSWEHEIETAAAARGMSAENAAVFASAMLAAMEGAFVLSKAQASDAPHVNAARALKALAAALAP